MDDGDGLVFEKVFAPRVRFQCPPQGSSSGWMHAMVCTPTGRSLWSMGVAVRCR